MRRNVPSDYPLWNTVPATVFAFDFFYYFYCPFQFVKL